MDNLISLKPAPGVDEVMAVKDGRGSVVGYYRGETPTQGLWVTADYTPEGRATQRDWVAGTSCTESKTTQCPRLGGLPFGFHGAYKSPAHGLLYFRNRWYSVEAGQWLTHDPLGEVDSVNLYAFNRFDSVNFVDPFGLEKQGAAGGCREPGKFETVVCGKSGKKEAEEKAAAEKAALGQEQNALKRDQPKPASPLAEKKEEPASAPKKVAKATYELWKGYGEFLGDIHWSYWVFPNPHGVATANAKVDKKFSMFLVQSGLTQTDVSSIGLLLASLGALPEAQAAVEQTVVGLLGDALETAKPLDPLPSNVRPATEQPMGGGGLVLRDGEGATAAEMAASTVGQTAGNRNGQAAVRQATLDAVPPGEPYTCWRCGQTSTNPADMQLGHRNVPTSRGGNLEPANVCLEGAACNLSSGNRGGPSPGMSCAERGGCGAPYGR
ncbi:MAG: RHS repeat-associated core domain-containing protein [Myxococcales bacterium]|nr:RHS repeat-associated core domain-containing protein [Myxococcales bacterium]